MVGSSRKLLRGSPGSTADNVAAITVSEVEDDDIIGGENSSPLPQKYLRRPSPDEYHSLHLEMMMLAKMWEDATCFPG